MAGQRVWDDSKQELSLLKKSSRELEKRLETSLDAAAASRSQCSSFREKVAALLRGRWGPTGPTEDAVLERIREMTRQEDSREKVSGRWPLVRFLRTVICWVLPMWVLLLSTIYRTLGAWRVTSVTTDHDVDSGVRAVWAQSCPCCGRSQSRCDTGRFLRGQPLRCCFSHPLDRECSRATPLPHLSHPLPWGPMCF